MTETKLISIRVPAQLLELIDNDATRVRPMNRSQVIINILQGVYDSTTNGGRFVLLSWPLRKKGNYQLSIEYKPNGNTEEALRTNNLITL